MRHAERVSDHAARLDASDPLAKYRERFVIDDPSLVYLKGNSLGRLPLEAQKTLSRAIREEWGGRLVRAWNEGWYEAPTRIGDKIGRLIGAQPGECIVAGSTSANLHALLWSACRLQSGRTKIVTDRRNFPSDVYVMQGVAEALSLELVVADDEVAAMDAVDEETAVLSLSHVAYREGFRYDLHAVNARARAAGALTLWDFSHSVGVVPIQAAGCDLAVGCTYKYLNGGPGAPAFLYVRRDLQDRLRPPVQGWFGHAEPFRFDLEYVPAAGIRRFLAGTPPILSLLGCEAGVDLCLEAGSDAVWRKADDLVRTFLAGLPEVEVETPADSERRGAHVSISHPEAFRLSRVLIQRGVVCDYREPGALRFGFSPLYTRFADAEIAAATLREVLETRAYEQVPLERPPVT